jgi:glucuronosyltransferase
MDSSLRDGRDSSETKLDDDVVSSSSQLNVLMISSSSSHAYLLMALGEELATRGHNVSFCTTDGGYMSVKDKVINSGMNYISAGVITTVETPNQLTSKIRESKGLEKIKAMIDMSSKLKDVLGFDVMLNYTLNNDLHQWDVIVVEEMFKYSITCIAASQGVKVIGTGTREVVENMIPWSNPFIGLGYSSDMSFSNRLVNEIIQIILKTIGVIFSQGVEFKMMGSKFTNQLCKDTFRWRPVEGWEYPFIISTVMGLEYPRPLAPMTDYVGPILSQKALDQSLPEDINQWLNNKGERSVIYISMGSHVIESSTLAKALIDGTMDSNYSVIWSLKKPNQTLIEDLDKDKYFISSWLPQVTVLRHKSISMAILHGGPNGIQEALYYGIPCINLPHLGDQYDWAVRVADAGVGINLNTSHIESSTIIKEAIEEIESGDYRSKADKMKIIMRRGGGAKKAADLVEYYTEVGYDHLLAAPIKYKWNWIQYYNIDVYITLMCLVLVCVWMGRMCCKCCHYYCCCCSMKKKLKKN